MKKILFIDNQQFGYLTDSYKYCEILKDRYEITYLCFDKGFEKQTVEGVRVKYVSYLGNKKVRGIRFILRALYEAAFFKVLYLFSISNGSTLLNDFCLGKECMLILGL